MANININWKDKYIEINGVFPAGGSYDISFEQLIREGLGKWVPHLREKNWWTKELEAEFIKAKFTLNEYGKG